MSILALFLFVFILVSILVRDLFSYKYKPWALLFGPLVLGILFALIYQHLPKRPKVHIMPIEEPSERYPQNIPPDSVREQIRIDILDSRKSPKLVNIIIYYGKCRKVLIYKKSGLDNIDRLNSAVNMVQRSKGCTPSSN